jgi:hypothetical protein
MFCSKTSWTQCRNGCAPGGLRVISLHMKLKCAELFINSSSVLFLNVRSELQVAFSRATVFCTEISLKWHTWFILIKSLTLKIPIPNSLTYLFLWLPSVFHGVQGLLVKNKTMSYTPGNTVPISTEVSCTLEKNFITDTSDRQSEVASRSRLLLLNVWCTYFSNICNKRLRIS